MKRLAAMITVSLVVSLGMATSVAAKEKPKGRLKVDLHATIACTGTDISANGAFSLGQPPDPGLLFNIITGFTRSKTTGARKQATTLQGAAGDAQFAAINRALKWCIDHSYTPRTQ